MNTPESVKGLKVFSKKFLNDILKLNLKTPPDIVTGLVDTEGIGAYANYQDDLGNDSVIHNYRVKNPGSIDTNADAIRKKLFGKNRPLSQADFSELGNADSLGYTYYALSEDIGKLVQLSDYTVPSLRTVANQFDLSSAESIKVNILNNRFIPETIETFETKVLKNNNPQQPYVDDNGQLSNGFEPQQLTPGDILSLNVNSNYNYTEDPLSYLKYSGYVLQNETILMNIAALELRSAFDFRINQARQINNTLSANVTDAMSNPLTAINILKDPVNNLIGKNYNITVPQNIPGKAEQVIGSLLGTYDVVQYLNLDRTVPLTPTCFNTTNQGDIKANKTAFGKLISDLSGRSVSSDRDTALLNDTGSGQKFQLYSNLYFNKYAPNYDPKYQSGVFQSIDKTLQSIGGATGFLGMTGGKRPASRYYFGDRDAAPTMFITSDSYGMQVKGPEEITKVFLTDYDNNGAVKTYKEPGYDEVSSYGSVSTDFVWHKNGYTESFLVNPKTNERVDRIEKNNYTHFNDEDLRYSYVQQDNFKEGSILWKTQKLLDNSDTQSGINLAIEQTKTKFYDGMTLYSKGSAVITPNVQAKTDKQGNKIGNTYVVPGVNKTTGKRDAGDMNANSEFCRTWTKIRPYMGITNAMKYSELIRLERNSVMDRYGNYNIFPSTLNVNKNTNKQQSIFEKYGVSNNINEVTAKKYMFSLENLAWRDSAYLTQTGRYGQNGGDGSLPNSQRGPNGGRVMWFPPYDLKFTDDSSANWTTHQFLGRSEPIYTYNNTERSGTLSFKVVVDHPTILNVLVQKELKDLTDETVDEILNAFWAGCVNFDIYELARIWTDFSAADINYFEKVIAGLDTRKPNSEIIKKVDDSGSKTPTEKIDKDLTTGNEIVPIKGTVFFENDVPLLKDASAIKSYDEYFDTYVKLNQGDSSVQNSSTINGKTEIGQYIYYDRVIGSNSTEKYFLSNSLHADVPIYNLYQGYTSLKENLVGITTPGNNVVISLDSYTSSLDRQNQSYNEELAIRRFKSVAKWVVLKVLSDSKTNVIKNKSGDKIDATNIDNNFTDDGKLVLYRNSGVEGHDDEITIKLNTTKNVAPADAMKAVGGITYINPNNVDIPGVIGIPVVVISYGAVPSPSVKTYICTDSFENKNILMGKTIKIDGVSYTLTKDNFGCLVPSKKSGYTEADVVCSVTSIQASFNRKVDVNVVLTPNNNVKKDEKVQQDKPLFNTNVQPTGEANITKREIAQKLLNKLITEEDYFKALDQNSPTVFKTMAEKLKYFTPAFHSTTPEGLNSRLTFLQQCLRPGDTITTSNSASNLDARNTSFGKPPICVLRIGDFYNTKIVINSLNISYDPLIFDMNPEGIGVQPMIANVNMSFKYIGGSGLRQYVNQLQNALSFNYYANADVYDSRTFANTDPMERELINAEVNPFDKNSLDLIPIIGKAKTIFKNDRPFDLPTGTIGDVVTDSQNNEYLGANDYSMAKNSYVEFDTVTAFEPGTFVTDDSTGLYGKNYYKRLFDDKLNFSVLANVAGLPLSDTNAWQPVVNKNFGQQYYLNLYGNESYLPTIKMSYRNIFKKTYDNYITNINDYLDFITFDNTVNKKNEFLLHNLLNKNYTGNTLTGVGFINSTSKKVLKKELNMVTTNISDYYNCKAVNANYINYLSYSNKNYLGKKDLLTEPMKLYMYPQSLFYVNPRYNNSNQITSILSGNTYNPGYFTDGDNNQTSDVANIYIKNNIRGDYVNNFLNYFQNDIAQKINNDLLVYWYQDTNVLDNYITDLTETQRNTFKFYINENLLKFSADLNKKYTYDLGVKNEVNNQEFYLNMTGISTMLQGYDATYVDDLLYTYVVIPNESKLGTDVNKIFGYNPYENYLRILYLGDKSDEYDNADNYEDVIKLSDVKNIVNNSLSDVLPKFKNDFMLLGNGLYFYRQVSKSPDIINSPMILNSTNYNTIFSKTVLPKSIPLDSAIDVENDDFNFNITGTTGDDKIIFDDYSQIKNEQFNLITESLKNKTNGKTISKKYKMTYTYEKLSYEMLDFSNKTLGVILNDNSSNYDVGITNNGQTNLKNKLELTNDTVYNVLFTKENDGFYYFNVTGNTTDETYRSKILSLADVLNYNMTLTETYMNNVITNYENTGNVDVSVHTELKSLKGKSYQMSSISEVVLMEFFDGLYTNRKTHIDDIIKKISDSMKNSTESEKEKNRKLKKIKSAISAFFDQINKYNALVNVELNDTVYTYTEKVTTPLNTYVKSAFSSPNNKAVAPGKVKSEEILKGTDADYTLTLRSAPINSVDVPLNNIIIYNKKGK